MKYPETEKLGSLTVEEADNIIFMIDTYAKDSTMSEVLLHPDTIAAIEEVVRAVKKNTKTNFMGFKARGDELTLKIINPGDVKKSGTALTTWDFSATAGLDWFESDTADAPITLGEDEGRVYIAFADPVANPLAIAVQVEIGGDLVVGQTLNFRLVDGDKAPIIRLGEPWKLKPEKAYRIQVRYEGSGTDRLTPIAIKIGKASAMLTV
jgi:hypothetical protein